MANLELEKKKHVSLFRKIALGTWQTAYDPSVYGTMELRMDRAMDYIEKFRKKKQKRDDDWWKKGEALPPPKKP